MKQMKLHAAIASTILLASLAGCGGGGDAEAGSPTVFSVVPSTVTFTAPVGTTPGVCLAGGTQTVFIYGGAAPYQIDNTSPSSLSVDKTQVSDTGGSFTVTVTGGCLTTIPVVVKDKLNNIVQFTVTNGPAA
jgi:hypothetical protein